MLIFQREFSATKGTQISFFSVAIKFVNRTFPVSRFGILEVDFFKLKIFAFLFEFTLHFTEIDGSLST